MTVWKSHAGDHFEIDKADEAYCRKKKETLEKYGLKVFAIASHLVGQAVCDQIDERHKSILLLTYGVTGILKVYAGELRKK